MLFGGMVEIKALAVAHIELAPFSIVSTCVCVNNLFLVGF